MTLTLGIITYNGGHYIENLLIQMQHVVDEIIILDSFSTDNTIMIARKYNAKIFYQIFKGSYSELRNTILKKSTCDYVLFLDCDEVMEDVIFIESMDYKHDNIYAFPRKNYIDGKFQEDTYPDIQCRMVKTNCDIEFERNIHEVPKGFKYASILNTNIIHKKTNTEYIKMNLKYDNLITEDNGDDK